MAIEKGEEKKGQEVPKELSYDKILEIIRAQDKKIEELTKANTAGTTPTFNSDDIVKIIEASKKSIDTIDVDWEKGVDESQIPADDYLSPEKGIKFFAPCGGYTVCDDIRKGQRVLLPYGKKIIFFENPAVTKIQKGKYEELLVISEYVSHSKKEVEWLKKHRLFGYKFFESTSQTQSADVVRMQKLSRIMGHVQNYDITDLVKHATSYGVPVSSDYESVRQGLAMKILSREENMDHETRTKNFLDNSKDRLLVEKGIHQTG